MSGVEYPAGKFVPGLGKDVRIQPDELSPDLLERIEDLEERVAKLEGDEDTEEDNEEDTD